MNKEYRITGFYGDGFINTSTYVSENVGEALKQAEERMLSFGVNNPKLIISKVNGKLEQEVAA